MKAKRITAYMLRVDSDNGCYMGYLTEVENSLEAEQKYVGGLIDVIQIGEVDIIFNDEGKLMELPANRLLFSDINIPVDVIVGNIMCVRHNDDGDFTSILPNDIEYIEQHLRPVKITKPNIITCRSADKLPQYPKKLIYSERYPENTVIELTKPIDDPYTPKPAGARFCVSYVDDAYQLQGHWLAPYNGSLAVQIETDSFKIVE